MPFQKLSHHLPLIEDTRKKFKYLWLSTKSFSENFLFSNSWKREIFVIWSQNQWALVEANFVAFILYNLKHMLDIWVI